MNGKFTRKNKKTLSKKTVLWRYMAFEEFAALLMKRVLWFNRIDKFRDKTEGLYPPKYYDVHFLMGIYFLGNQFIAYNVYGKAHNYPRSKFQQLLT